MASIVKSINDKLFINSAGNVGIGTNSPLYKLNVIGDISFPSRNTAGTYRIGMGREDGNGWAYAQNIAFISDGNGGYITFSTQQPGVGGDEYMRLNYTGNLLIGTTTDNGYKLRISGSLYTSGQVLLVGATNVIIKNHSDYPWFEGQSASAQLFYGRSGQNPWGIGSDGAYAFRLWDSSFVANYFGITVGGNVLIGTTTDNGDKLQVSGNATIGAGSGLSRLTIGSGAGYTALILKNNSAYYNFLVGSQYNVSNAFEITPSTTVGGSTFSTPVVTVLASGNVGIGTTSPGYTLQVGSTSVNSSAAIIGNSTAGIEVRTNSAGGRIAALEQYFGNEGSLWLYLSNTAKILLRADGNSYFNGGNVGIGTTAPGSKLTIGDSFATIVGLTIDTGNGGDSAIVARKSASKPAFGVLPWDTAVFFSSGVYYDGNVWQHHSNDNNNQLFALDPAAGVRWYASNDGTPNWNVSSNQQLWDNNAFWTNIVRSTRAGDSYFTGGNVGIGTTAPTVPLQIVKDNATISMTNTTAFAVDTGSRLFLGGKYSSGTDNNTSAFAWIVGAKENATDGNQAGYLSITTVENGGGFAERMRITSTGNVGIGTTAPTAQLHIANASVAVVRAEGTATNGEATFQLLGKNSSGTARSAIFKYDNVDLLRIGIGQAVDMRFETNDTERMRITAAGNVGIGTTSPNNIFTIYAASSAIYTQWIQSGTGTTSTDGLRIGLDASSNGIIDLNEGTALITKVDGSERMRITAGGNVGIGTTNPANLLEVSVAGYGFRHYGDASNYLRTYAGSGYQILDNGTNQFGYFNGKFYVQTGGTDKLTIDTSGNVGIGTTSPTNPLTVTTATNAVDVLRLNNTGGDSGAVQGVTHLAINHFNGGTNPSTRITAYQDSTSGWPGGMYFSTRSLNTDSAPLERMRITSAGNIGIGTTSPQYMLDVNGDAQINAEGTGPAYAYVPDGAFGVDSLLTSGSENVALGKPDVWLRIHVDGVAFVFPGYQEP